MEELYNYREFISQFCKFCGYKTLVEIGVQNGLTTIELCKVAQITKGKVFGYDYFAPIGVYGNDACQSMGKIEELLLTVANHSFFKLTKIDSRTDEFIKILKEDTGGTIDFAFVDGDHSYDGIKNDFLKIYPLLTEKGTIMFHDTYSHAGCRKFVLDLYQDLNDGTFDIINLPYGTEPNAGGNQYGLTILTKRSYPRHKSGIYNTVHDKPPLVVETVYEEELSWYLKQLKPPASS